VLFAQFLACERASRYAFTQIKIARLGDSRMDTAFDHQDIAKLLEAHGLRATQQRLQVAEILISVPAHLTADQIIAMVRNAGARVSKATVYNTLHVLAEYGLVRPLHLDPTRVVYDSKLAPHHHFHNTETGELVDIAPEDIALTILPEPPPGTEIAGVEVVIRIRHKT
jgi:Fur family iron response transcriptional regulator